MAWNLIYKVSTLHVTNNALCIHIHICIHMDIAECGVFPHSMQIDTPYRCTLHVCLHIHILLLKVSNNVLTLHVTDNIQTWRL